MATIDVYLDIFDTVSQISEGKDLETKILT